MNHFSFQEEEEPRQLHCLGHEIGQHQIDTWMGNSQDRADEDLEFDGCILSHFDLNIPSLEEIPVSSSKQNKVCQQTCELLGDKTHEIVQQRALAIEQQSKPSIQQHSSQGGQTFYEQQNISSTIVQGNSVQEKWQKENGKALNQFIALSESIYAPMLASFKQMLSDIKQYSDKTMDNLNMYHLFFSIKLQQEKQRRRILQSERQGIQQLLSRNSLLEGVYLDQKVVIQQMMDHDSNRVQDLAEFCQSVEESCSKLKGLLSKSVEFRSKKVGHVLSYLEKTQSIHRELVQYIVNPPSVSDQTSWMGKLEIRCDRYLQRKFLQERERLFLSQLKALGEKIIGLLHSIFIKEEPVICAMLGRETQRYYNLSKQAYGSLMLYEHSTKVHMSEVNQNLKEALAQIIPAEWKMFISIDSSHIEQIINQIHGYMQNHIFLPTVAIEEGLVVVQQKAKWLCKSELSPKKQKNKKGTSSHGKENQLEGANQPTYAALVTQRINKQPAPKTRGMDVVAVLTADNYVHLESGQKIACLKLKRLKMKRKGQCSIVLNENSRSITNLFSPPLYLGELVFPSQKIADDFAKAVLSTLK